MADDFNEWSDWTPMGGAGPCIECGSPAVTKAIHAGGVHSRYDCLVCGATWRKDAPLNTQETR